MKRKPPIVPLVVLATLIGLGVYVDRQRAAKQSLISGVFEAQPTQVAPRQSGRVAKILAKEGQVVHKGDLLLELEAGPDALQVQALQATAAQALSRSEETKKGPRQEEIDRQVAVVEQLQAALDRAVAGPRWQEIEQAVQRLRQSQARLAEALRGARPEEIQAAEATARQAEAQYQIAQRGATPEERAQAQAKFDTARAQEIYANEELLRKQNLFKEGAIARRDLELVRAQSITAINQRKEAEQALLRIKRGTPAEELNQAKQGYLAAKARLDLLKAGTRIEEIRAAEADVAIAKQALALLREGTRSEDIRAARANLAQQQAALAQLRNGSRAEEIAQAESAAKSARLTMSSAQAKLSETKIAAPIDGVVDRIFVADGDLVNAGTMVVRLNNPQDIWIRVYVPETLLNRVKAGDSASLSIDGIPEEIPAVVENIATEGEYTPANLQTPEERGKQVFAVRIRLTKPDARIKAGMTATVKALGTWR